MKKMFFNLSAILLLISCISTGIQAQNYCLWIVNNRYEDLYELKVKKTTSNTFSQDLLPDNMVESGKAFWIKVSDWPNDLGDIQITDDYGDPLEFTLKTVGGGVADFPYIRLNFHDIHTLVLNENGTFSIYNDDKYGLGHPCGN